MVKIMLSKKILVVGDKFKEFADNKYVLTISQLELLAKIPSKFIDSEHEVIPGQGIRQDLVKEIVTNHKRDPECYNNKLNVYSLEKLVHEEKNRYSHKNFEQNILIGQAEKVEHQNNLYVLPLMIDERCEIMADHQTGQHIQGMLQIEACRQSFIAVTEEFIYEKMGGRYYVINNMSISFFNFLFPLAALVHFELIEQDINERRGRFKAQIRVKQSEILCSTMEVSFSVYPSESIRAKEKDLAVSATQEALMMNQEIELRNAS
jgi:hypothetical protein